MTKKKSLRLTCSPYECLIYLYKSSNCNLVLFFFQLLYSGLTNLRQGKTESKLPKSATPCKVEDEASESVSRLCRKSSAKITPKKAFKKTSSKSLRATRKKTKRKRTKRSAHGEISKVQAQSETESDSDATSDSAAEVGDIPAISSDEMSVKYSDYKYQIVVTSDEGSDGEGISENVPTSKREQPNLDTYVAKAANDTVVSSESSEENETSEKEELEELSDDDKPAKGTDEDYDLSDKFESPSDNESQGEKLPKETEKGEEMEEEVIEEDESEKEEYENSGTVYVENHNENEEVDGIKAGIQSEEEDDRGVEDYKEKEENISEKGEDLNDKEHDLEHEEEVSSEEEEKAENLGDRSPDIGKEQTNSNHQGMESTDKLPMSETDEHLASDNSQAEEVLSEDLSEPVVDETDKSEGKGSPEVPVTQSYEEAVVEDTKSNQSLGEDSKASDATTDAP